MTLPAHVLCLCGSLRRVSSNRAALQAVQQQAPATLQLELYEGLGTLPLFNPDDERDPLPSPVRALRSAINRADVLLIACPEYAHGVPGAFKNLLDWLVGSMDFPGKLALLLNTSARDACHAQASLAEILSTMSARLLTTEPLSIGLPGAGCSVAQVLADPHRGEEIQRVLDTMVAALTDRSIGI